MKTIATLTLITALATASAVSAQDATTDVADPFVATAGPAAGLTPGLIAAGIAITIIGIASAIDT